MDFRDEVEAIVRRGFANCELNKAVDELMELLPVDFGPGWLAENEHMRNEIVDVIMPEVLALWLRKNDDYAGQQVFLGKRAQFADLNRKFWKLKSAMWDGVPPQFETEEQMQMDMIGHLLMAIYMGRYGG